MKVIVFDGNDFVFVYEGADEAIIRRVTKDLLPVVSTPSTRLFCLNEQALDKLFHDQVS